MRGRRTLSLGTLLISDFSLKKNKREKVENPLPMIIDWETAANTTLSLMAAARSSVSYVAQLQVYHFVLL